MNKKRQYKTYPKVFKEEAVALVLEQGYSVTEAAQSLNIKDNLLYNWKQQHAEESSGSMLGAQEKTELIQLRKDNKRLKMEKEILKKASAFFAREMK
jgi:transposase